MTQIGGIREGHRKIERSHGEGGDDIPFQVGPFILGCPIYDGNIVGKIPEDYTYLISTATLAACIVGSKDIAAR